MIFFVAGVGSLHSLPLYLHSQFKRDDLVAQLVEQYTFNVWALGSSPSRITNKKAADFSAAFLFVKVDRTCTRKEVPWPIQ